MTVPSAGCLQKAAMVEGIMAMDWAKMMAERRTCSPSWEGGCLAAVHLTAHLTLGILHGDAALGAVDPGDQNDQSEDAEHHQHDGPHSWGC